MGQMLIAIMAAVLFSVTAHAAVGIAKSANDQQDRWGLTETDWSEMTGPRSREVLGFPDRFSEVLSAARRGDPMAMAVIAGAYAVGSGTDVDPEAASRWAEAAAQSNLGFPLYVLAKMEQFGTARPVNMDRYRNALGAAMRAGHREAAFELGAYYAEAKAYSQAAPPLRSAAERDHVPAQYTLALVLSLYDHHGSLLASEEFKGDGAAESAYWFDKAARTDYEKSRIYAEIMARQVMINEALEEETAPRSQNGGDPILHIGAVGGALLGGQIYGSQSWMPCTTLFVTSKGTVAVDWSETKPTSNAVLEGNIGIYENGEIAATYSRLAFAAMRGATSRLMQLAVTARGRELNELCQQISSD